MTLSLQKGRNAMKIAVIGLGSMGKRRIRLLTRHFPEHTVVGVDTQESRCEECSRIYGIRTFSSLSAAMESCRLDAAFVCTSPLSHRSIIAQALQAGLQVFTEINLLSDGYDENLKTAEEKGLVLFLSSTFFYREEIRFVRQQLAKQTQPVSYTYHVGQYLPDWHPWESYQSFFLGDKRTNGCREIMAIDFPWIIKTFGRVTDFHAFRSKMTRLDIDYPDTYVIALKHESGALGTFVADVVARSPFRELRISGEQLLLCWDGTPNSLRRFDPEQKEWEQIKLYEQVDQLENYSATITENAYLEEIKAFLAQVERGELPPYTFYDDYETLKLIDRIEQETC